MMQMLMELKGEIDKLSIIVVNFNHTLSRIDRSSKQQFSKDVFELKNTFKLL